MPASPLYITIHVSHPVSTQTQKRLGKAIDRAFVDFVGETCSFDSSAIHIQYCQDTYGLVFNRLRIEPLANEVGCLRNPLMRWFECLSSTAGSRYEVLAASIDLTMHRLGNPCAMQIRLTDEIGLQIAEASFLRSSVSCKSVAPFLVAA